MKTKTKPKTARPYYADGKKPVQTWLDPADHKSLRIAAATCGESLIEFMANAIRNRAEIILRK